MPKEQVNLKKKRVRYMKKLYKSAVVVTFVLAVFAMSLITLW